MNKKGRPSSYLSYSKEYDRVKSVMASKGYTMAERKFTEEEWKRAHWAVRNDRLRDIKEGKRKTIGYINRDLIREQTWRYSQAQARAQLRAYKLSGGKENLKILDIRGEKVRAVDWDALSAREKELRAQGWGWGRVHATVSEEFFGS